MRLKTVPANASAEGPLSTSKGQRLGLRHLDASLLSLLQHSKAPSFYRGNGKHVLREYLQLGSAGPGIVRSQSK